MWKALKPSALTSSNLSIAFKNVPCCSLPVIFSTSYGVNVEADIDFTLALISLKRPAHLVQTNVPYVKQT